MHVMTHVASALCKDDHGGLAHAADGLGEVLLVVARLRGVRDPAARPGDLLGALVSGWGISGRSQACPAPPPQNASRGKAAVVVDEATRPIPGAFSGRNLQRLEELSCPSDDRRLGAWDTSAAPGATVGRGVTRSRQTHRGRHRLDRS